MVAKLELKRGNVLLNKALRRCGSHTDNGWLSRDGIRLV